MIRPLCSGVLLAEPKDLVVDFPLQLGLWLPRRFELLGARFLELICLWLMIWLHVVSLNIGGVNPQCEPAKHKRQRSTLWEEDATFL